MSYKPDVDSWTVIVFTSSQNSSKIMSLQCNKCMKDIQDLALCVCSLNRKNNIK